MPHRFRRACLGAIALTSGAIAFIAPGERAPARPVSPASVIPAPADRAPHAGVRSTTRSPAAALGRVYSSQLPGRGRNEALLGAAVSPDGTVWVSDQADDDLIAITPRGAMRRVRLEHGALDDIENRASDVWTVGAVYVGPTGAVFVAEHGAIARVADGKLRRYRIPSGRYGSPAALTSSADGDIWFTEVNRPYIGRLDPRTGTIRQFSDGTGARGIPGGGITTGPDGRLWYTLPSYYRFPRGALGAITTGGRARVYRPDAHGLLQAAWGIVAARGSLWVLGSRLGAAPRGQPQSGLLRVTPAGRRATVVRFGPDLGTAAGNLAVAPDGTFYAVGGALGASGAIVSVSRYAGVRRYNRANGQVGLFGAGGNLTPLAAAADGSLWLGADDGVLEHLLPHAAEPCVVPHIVGYRAVIAVARLQRDHCLARVGRVSGPRDTPAIVTAQARAVSTVLNPGTGVRLSVRRGVPYACDPSGNSDPSLTVLRISCAAALRLFHVVYNDAIKHGSTTADGFACHYRQGTAIQGMGGGEVACRARDARHRLRVDDMFYAPPR